MKIYEGQLVGTGLRVGVVVSRFNSFISEKLLEGAVDALRRHGVDEADIRVAWVPGAFEIPGAARKMVESRNVDAVVCLGSVIRGATPHFDYVAGQATRGVGDLSARSPIPVIFGVLTTDTIEQAIERAGTKAGNKGAEAAVAAIEMANLYKSMEE